MRYEFIFYVIRAIGKFKRVLKRHVEFLEPYRHPLFPTCDQCGRYEYDMKTISHSRYNQNADMYTSLCSICDRKYGNTLQKYLDQEHYMYLPISVLPTVAITKTYNITSTTDVLIERNNRIETWHITSRSALRLKDGCPYVMVVQYIDDDLNMIQKSVRMDSIIRLNPSVYAHCHRLNMFHTNLTEHQKCKWERAWNSILDLRPIYLTCLHMTRQSDACPGSALASHLWRHILEYL